MRIPFKLALNIDRKDLVPHDGEDIGGRLRIVVENYVKSNEAEPNRRIEYWGPVAAQLYMLASQAYRFGSMVTIGHNRSARYDAAAADCEQKAGLLFDRIKANHIDTIN